MSCLFEDIEGGRALVCPAQGFGGVVAPEAEWWGWAVSVHWVG